MEDITLVGAVSIIGVFLRNYISNYLINSNRIAFFRGTISINTLGYFSMLIVGLISLNNNSTSILIGIVIFGGLGLYKSASIYVLSSVTISSIAIRLGLMMV